MTRTKLKLFAVLPLILCMVIFPIYAADVTPPRLVDNGDLLDSAEEEQLAVILDEVSEARGCDVVVVTADSLEGKSAQAYADDYFDYNGYGQGEDHSGVLLLVSMAEREWWISTSGSAIIVLDDYRLMQIEDEILGDLSAGDYYDAFEAYAELCDTYFEQAENGEVYDQYGDYYGDAYADPYYSYDYGYDYGYGGSDGFSPALLPVISVLAAFVISLIIVNVMKGELNTVRYQTGAASYEKKGSFRLTSQRDIYLYRKVTKIARQTDSNRSGGTGRSGGSSVHRSSSGRSHGGRGGRF